MDDFDSRSKLILREDFNKLQNFNICVIGLGGVGSIVPISLARSGFKNFLLIDKDKVDISNLNRQIAYSKEDLNRYKTSALKDHLLKLREDLSINTKEVEINLDTDLEFLDSYDYVIDCIDSINGKKAIIKYCLNKNINVISSLGMGNRLDPSKVEVTKLNKTTSDPLARKLRYELKKDNVDISKVVVSFSSEKPIINNKVIGSMIFVPNVSGLLISSYVLRQLLAYKGD